MASKPIKRPQASETEEDLLRFQEEFLRSKSCCSTSVVDKSKSNPETSKAPCDNVELNACNVNKSSKPEDAKRVKFDIDLDPKSIFADGYQVVERDTRNVTVRLPTANTRPFPKVFKANKTVDTVQSVSGGSLFAKRIQLNRVNKLHSKGSSPKVLPMEVSFKPTIKKSFESDLANKSIVVDGSGLAEGQTKESVAKEIHEENLKRIAEMSSEEISKAQQEIMRTLDPGVVEFLKSKRKLQANLSPKISTVTMPSTSKLNKVESMEVEHANNKIETSQDFKEEELPIRPAIAKKWLHMDKVEKGKLEWMTDLPKVDSISGGTARFDFDGKVILSGAETSVREGLHHHGDEPGLAGYTLEELLYLSQSSMSSQKVLALTTLSNIVSKIHEGYYDERLSRPLLPDIAVGPIVILFRAALDDNTSVCIAASVAIIHSLVVAVPDELSLDETFLWHRGDMQPFCQVEIQEKQMKSTSEDSPKEQELSDAALIELDLIKGLIRMDLLPRLRYIIEVLRPSAPVVIQVLEIISKLTRHSVESAVNVMKTPRLLNVLFKEFCTKTWFHNVDCQMQDGKLTSFYGIPTYQVIKIFRGLASADRQLASELLSSYDIVSSLLHYLSVSYQELYLPPKEAMVLCLESLRTWQVFLRYGLTTEAYEEFYPLIIRQMTAFQNICFNVDSEKHTFDCDYAASWLKLLSVVLKLTLPMSTSDTSVAAETKSSEDVLGWDKVAGLIDIVELCLSKWLWEMSTFCETTRSGSRLLATALNFVSTFYDTWSKQPYYNHSDVPNRIENLYVTSILPFLLSQGYTKLISDLRNYSVFKDSFLYAKDRNTSNLPSLNAVLWSGTVTSILDRQSPFPVLIDLLRLLFKIIHLNNKLADDVVLNLLENQAVLSYLKTITLFDISGIAGHWFSRFECYFLFNLLLICDLKKCSHMSLYHEVALKLFHLMQRGDDILAKRILSEFIFNPNFTRELNEASLLVENLRIEEDPQNQNLLEINKVPQSKLIIATGQVLSNISQTYQTLLAQLLSESGHHSGKRFGGLFVSHYKVPLVPKDFFYLPLLMLYRDQIKHKLSLQDFRLVTLNNEQTATYCLQWCHFVSCFRRNADNNSVQRLVYLMMSFLISPDFFLKSEPRRYLEGCFQQMAQKNEFSHINLNISVENGSYNDFFIQLLDQFEAMSYGDHLFGMIVLLSMQRNHPIQQRGAIWADRTNALSLVNVTLKELPIPLQYYLQPIEEDHNLLASYFKALLNGRVALKRNPILYLIAVHHLHHFLFDDDSNHEILKKNILIKLLDAPNEILSYHLQCYIEPDVNSELGFTCCETPSTKVLGILTDIQTKLNKRS